VSRHLPLLLVSGLPLTRESSFSRQLRLLSQALKRKGIPSVVCAADSLARTLGSPGARALLLLGYPDQFAFLDASDLGVPVFLWAQFSHPPDPQSFGPALPVPLTPRTAEFLLGCGRVGPVIPHGVDTRFYRPAEPGRRGLLRRLRGLEKAFVVGTVAANTLRKRFDLMVEAFAGLRRSRPEALLVVKTDRVVSLDGSDLERQARRHGVESGLRVILGEYTPAAMVELYQTMDVYLNLSEWEGFCLPVLEAMSSGVPVVTHPVQGPGEIVPYTELFVAGSRREQEDGVTLLRADPRSAAELLADAADSPELLRKLGERGRLEAVERYELWRVAGRWEQLLETVRGR
jgi:glycosyltransferase involved in cell wall biosynthesis